MVLMSFRVAFPDMVPQTEEPYATAWIGYKYIGRIRPSDGLVVLLREPVSLHALSDPFFVLREA